MEEIEKGNATIQISPISPSENRIKTPGLFAQSACAPELGSACGLKNLRPSLAAELDFFQCHAKWLISH
jgi:hypothetical protein